MANYKLTGEESFQELKQIAKKIGAATDNKMKKEEVIEAILSIDVPEVEEAPEMEDEVTEEELKEFLGTKKLQTADQKEGKKVKTKKKLERELMKYHRVVVIPNDEQTRQRQMMFISWGNDVIGHHTDKVVFETPWHVREGALNNLRAAKMTKQDVDKNGNLKVTEIDAYNISELDLLSEEEYKRIGEKQKLRDAAIDSADMQV